VDATAPAHEFFLDVEVPMNAAASYPISLEGYTGGEYVNFFTAFVDFDQDGVFNNAEEMFEIGSIENSTGLDGQAASGNDHRSAGCADRCDPHAHHQDRRELPRSIPASVTSFGQVEGLHGDHLRDRYFGVSASEEPTIAIYPNPADDVLRIQSSTRPSNMVTLFNAQGQEVAQPVACANRAGVIDISALSIGVYTLRATTRDSSFVFNVVKE
jgi:hypothetical protein